MRSDIIAMLADKYPNYQSQHYYDKTPDDLKTIIDSSGSSDLFFYVLYSRGWNNLTYHAVSYLIEESGKFFEPKLVNIFVSNIEQIETIRGATYEDELNDFSQMYHYLKEQMDE